mgnify:CR=1 FL=1
MSQSKVTAPKVVAVSALSFGGGVAGIVLVRTYGTALETEPAWVGPAIFVGAVCLVLIGVLCLPAALRVLRAKPREPGA